MYNCLGPVPGEVNEYPVERESEIAWILAEDIEEAACMYAGAKPVAIHWGVPIDMTPPFPTELRVLCAGRTKQGLQPACVQHCMAACMKYGRLEDLVKEVSQKPRQVLWAPR